jgi:hypothetical protein
MPEFDAFRGVDNFYNVAFHEFTHNADARIMTRRTLRVSESMRFQRAPARHNQRDSRRASSLGTISLRRALRYHRPDQLPISIRPDLMNSKKLIPRYRSVC